MKNCQSDQSQQPIIINTQNYQSKNTVQLRDITCVYGHEANMVCMSKKCKNNVFVCSYHECQCKQHHQACLKTDCQSFLSNLQTKPVNIQIFQNFIDENIQYLIDFLSQFRQAVIQKLKQQYQQFGTTLLQSTFLNHIKQNNHQSQQNINGRKVWQLIQLQQQKQIAKSIVDKSLQIMKDQFINTKQSFKQHTQSIVKQMFLCMQKVQKDMTLKITQQQKIISQSISPKPTFEFKSFQSKILQTNQQFQSLQNIFFPQKIHSASLLYRASQNKFALQKFYSECVNSKETLILVETQFGKKIGGYNPRAWRLTFFVQNYQTPGSFIFSLTQSDKFQLKNNKPQIDRSPKIDEKYTIFLKNQKQGFFEYGPTFGNDYDLRISNFANMRKNSFSNICSSYKNNNYAFNERKSWQRFCGNASFNDFKIKQWQVWQIQTDKSINNTNK